MQPEKPIVVQEHCIFADQSLESDIKISKDTQIEPQYVVEEPEDGESVQLMQDTLFELTSGLQHDKSKGADCKVNVAVEEADITIKKSLEIGSPLQPADKVWAYVTKLV